MSLRQSSWIALCLVSLCLIVPCLPSAELAGGPDEEGLRRADDPLAFVRPSHRRWLEDVELLITDTERRVFLDLNQDYQRDAFIDAFWKVRDPFPATRRNEFRDSWNQRVEAAREVYDDLRGEGARIALLFGAPTRRLTHSCQVLRQSVEVWHFDGGSDFVRGYFTVVFQGLSRGDFARTWSIRDGLSMLVSPGWARGSVSDAQLGRVVTDQCPVDGARLLEGLALALDVEDVLAKTKLIPEVNDEWVLTFRARSTEVPEDAPRMHGELAVSYPGRHQSRTVVQALVTLSASEARAGELGGQRAFHFLVDGEVLRKGELFDQFRYRFDLPAGTPGAGEPRADVPHRLPLVVQRYLRPGDYSLVLKVEDTEAKSYFRAERELTVPRVEPRRRPIAVAADGSVRELTEDELARVDRTAFEDLAGVDVEAAMASAETSLAEANASISTGDHAVKFRPLPQELSVGQLRVEAAVRGAGVDKVTFLLNDRPVMSKRTPPYSVELNLGEAPRIHTLRAVAVDEAGEFLATDEILVNAGPHRFDVRLLEPQRGKKYHRSVRAHAEVEVPEGEVLDRVELYLDDTRLATLYQPPFEQPILLPEDLGLAYVRAVAYLVDGGSTEAVQFINAPDFVDELKVNFVELYTSVLDRKGEFARGLTADDFEVFEEGEKQEIRRFETMDDLPIRAGLVLDTSLSMENELDEVEKAAYRFFETVLQPRDRACVITFADEPHLAVRFTNDKSILAGGLAGLVAEGETALYDSLVFALHYFSGLKGKRAIIVLTDGEDSMSEYRFEDAVEFARRTGASIYVIGLGLSSSSADIRAKLASITQETGGELFFIDSARNLGRVYEQIQQDLRSQYLIAYQSSAATAADEYRKVEIEVKKKGLEAKSLRGYYP